MLNYGYPKPCVFFHDFHGCRNNSDIAHFRTLPRDLLNHGLWGVVNARGVGLIIPIYGTVDMGIGQYLLIPFLVG